MPTQYVRVLFHEPRVVQVDDTESGETNQLLMLEEGTHRFALAGEADYVPPYVEQVVTGTTPVQPLELQFEPATAKLPIKKV